MIARDATRFEKDAQARDVTLFWRRAPSSAEPACVSPYLFYATEYMGSSDSLEVNLIKICVGDF